MDLTTLTQSTLSIMPELIVVITAILAMMSGPLLRDENNSLRLIISLVLLGASFYLNLGRFTDPQTAFGGSLSLDSFSAFFNSIFLACAALTLVISRDYLGKTTRLAEFYSLVLFSTAGMMILAESKDFMSLFLGFEIMSVSVYILSGFNRKSINSTESGIKYLILGGFSSALLLYGIALLYGASGSVYFDTIISTFNTENPLFIAGTALILAGFIFKIGAFPLHQWVPDIYQGAPVPVTTFMSVNVKAAAFAILLRFIFETTPYQDISLTNLIIIVSVLTMTIGNVAAIVQGSIKRMLAYSSIAHAGYILVGILAGVNGKQTAIDGVLYYLYAYAIMNLGAFAIISYLSREDRELDDFERISGLWNRKPLIAIALGVFMFSLAGIPPTLGFFAKYRIFLSAVNAGFSIVVIIALVNSVISAYYYLKLLVYAFMKEDIYDFGTEKQLTRLVVIVLAIGTLLLGIFPLYSIDMTSIAGSSLFSSGF